MPGPISDELIMRLTLQYEQFIKGMRESSDALKQFQKDASSPTAAGGIGKNVSKQFGQIERYASVMGDSMGAVKEKIQLFQGAIRNLTNEGSAGSMQLAKAFKGNLGIMQKQLTDLEGKQGVFQKLTSGLQEIGGPAGQLGNVLAKLGSGFGAISAGIMLTKASWDVAIGPGIRFNMMLEQQKMAFSVMMKSEAAATNLLVDLKQLTIETGVSLADSMSSAKQMMAYGFGQDEMVTSLKMMNTVAKAVGVPMTDLTYVYGTLRAQGRAYTRDLMQFGMRGIPIYEYLAKVLNTDVQSLKKLVEEGKIGFPEVEKAFQAMTGEGGKFEGMLEKSMQTNAGLITQIKNQWQLATGDMTEAFNAPINMMLKGVLDIIKNIKALSLYFQFWWTILIGIGVLLVKAADALMIIFQIYVRIGESLVDGVLGIGKWIADLINLKGIIFDIQMGFKGARDWLYEHIPLLRDIEQGAKNVANAIKKWFDNSAKKSFKVDIENIKKNEGFTALFHALKEYDKLNLLVAEGNYTAAASALDSMDAYKAMGFTVEDMAKVMANYFNLTEDEYNKFIESTKKLKTELIGYFSYFKKLANKPMSFFKASDYTTYGEGYGTGAAVGQDVVAGYRDELKKMNEVWSSLNMDPEIMNDKAKSWKEDTLKYLQSVVDDMSQQSKFMLEGSGGLGFLRALQAYIDQLNDEIGADKKGKKNTVFDDFLQQYLEFRAEMASVEKGFGDTLIDALNAKLGGNADITKNTSMLDRQLELIKQKYEDIAKSMTAMEFSTAFPAINQMKELEILAAKLNYQLKEIQDRREITTSGKESIALLKEQYNIQLEINKLTNLTDAERLANAKSLVETQEKLVQLYQEGDQAAISRQANALMTDQGAEGSVTAGTAMQAAAGTDIGKLAAGGDPIYMFLKALAEMLMSIENVNKTLNFFGTIMDGMKSMIEGPLNAALAPLIMFLTKLGEVLGAIIVPFIEIFGDTLGMILAPFNLIAELVKRMLVALKPLIKLIIYIQSPFLALGDLLSDIVAAMSAAIQTEEDQQADLEDLYNREVATLQNLYEVGALSGAEYEARLAELRARYGMEGQGDPEMTAFLQGIFDAITEMGEALNAMFLAFKPVIDFLLALVKPVFTLLISLLGGFFSDIAKVVTSLANLATAIANGIFKGDWSGVWNALKGVLRSLAGFFLNPLIRALNFFIDGLNWLIPGDGPLSHVPEFATGTGFVPNDMLAMLHRGEMVTPASFADAIRSGDLAIGSGSGRSSGGIIVNVYNAGSVITERDLCTTVYEGIASLKKKGYL